MSFGLHGFYPSTSLTLFMRGAHHQHNTGSADSDGLASADITDLSHGSNLEIAKLERATPACALPSQGMFYIQQQTSHIVKV